MSDFDHLVQVMMSAGFSVAKLLHFEMKKYSVGRYLGLCKYPIAYPALSHRILCDDGSILSSALSGTVATK